MGQRPETIITQMAQPNVMKEHHFRILAMRGAGQNTAEIAMRMQVTEVFVETCRYEMFQLLVNKQGIALIMSMLETIRQKQPPPTFDIEGSMIDEAIMDPGQPRRRRTDSNEG